MEKAQKNKKNYLNSFFTKAAATTKTKIKMKMG